MSDESFPVVRLGDVALSGPIEVLIDGAWEDLAAVLFRYSYLEEYVGEATF